MKKIKGIYNGYTLNDGTQYRLRDESGTYHVYQLLNDKWTPTPFFFNTIKEYKAALTLFEDEDEDEYAVPFKNATLENLYKSCESYFWNTDRKDTLLSLCAEERISALICRLNESGYEVEFGKISRTCIIACEGRIVDIKNFNYI